MTNPNRGDQYDRTNPTGENAVVRTNPGSYGSGYHHGRAVERQRYEAVQEVRDENNTANGLLIGILLTGLVLGGAALTYFATHRNPTPLQRTIIIPGTAPSPSPAPEVKERIIERDQVVPVPQPQQSSPTVIPAPNIKIEAPQPAPSAPASQASPTTPSTSKTESPKTEQPRSTNPDLSPEATASPAPSNSGQ